MKEEEDATVPQVASGDKKAKGENPERNPNKCGFRQP